MLQRAARCVCNTGTIQEVSAGHKDVLACMQLVPGSGAILQAGTDPSCQHTGLLCGSSCRRQRFVG